jgi:hypothetical protein
LRKTDKHDNKLQEAEMKYVGNVKESAKLDKTEDEHTEKGK